MARNNFHYHHHKHSGDSGDWWIGVVIGFCVFGYVLIKVVGCLPG